MNTKSILRFLLVVLGLAAVGSQAASAQEAALRIGQSFVLRVTGVPQEDQIALSQQYTIGDNGLIRLQYIEPVKAAGLKPSELARNIEQAYKGAEIYSKPTVNVTAGDPGQDITSYISVLGEVKLPQNVPFRPGMTILDAIAACGGFTDFAKAKNTTYISGATRRTADLRNASGADAGIKLKVGDKIVVPD